MIIESKISPWLFYNTIAYAIVGILVCMPFYLDENEKKETEIVWSYLFIALMVVIFIAIIMYRAALRSIFRVQITEKEILLNQYTKQKIYRFSHDEIKGMSWQNKNRTFGAVIARGPTINVNNQAFWVYFKDGSELEALKANYENYEELANWFFSYCRKKEIIKIDPLEVRKRSRYRRQEKVTKPKI